MKLTNYLFLLILIVFGCNKAPEPINYGIEVCNFCQMTIVSKAHAAQLVTQKGKQLKFDAIECMINHFRDSNHEENSEVLLVANLYNPGEMLSAKDATYLISPNIQSPMGANLSAFKTKNEANKALDKHEGTIYTWETLKLKMNIESGDLLKQ